MKQKIFLGIGIILLTVFGFAIYKEFMLNHTYYNDMFSNRQNRNVIILGIFSILFPLGYILLTKKFSLKNLIVKRLPAGLLFFGLGQIVTKGELIGQTGLLMFIVNTLFLYFLGAYFILGLTSIGKIVNKYWIKLENKRIQELFLDFGVGLGIFLLLIKIITSLGILYGAVSRLIFIGFGVAIYFSRKELGNYKILIEDIFSGLSLHSVKSDNLLRIGVVLLGISLLYYFYGFNLSFVPYSTARDANHAYMYVPKVLAENHGVIRGNIGVASASPQLWHGFITFRFSLIGGIKRFWLAPDTIAVSMNFLSAIFVLILGLGTIREVISYSTKKGTETRKITFYLGRFLILLRLTSGMGAFLVFVDNKTDLGVMAITMLGMLSGFIFLNYIKDHETSHKKEIIKYIIISGVFFALAGMSKQTAFIDIVLFGLLLIGMRINSILAIGLGLIVTGMTGILEIANAKDLMSPAFGKQIVLVGAIISIIGLLRYLTKTKSTKIKKTLAWIGIRTVGVVSTLILFKGPFIVYEQIRSGEIQAKEMIKSLLFANTGEIENLQKQTEVDQTKKENIGLEACNILNFSKEELAKNTKKAVIGNEDVGRYVGYGRKEFNRSNGIFYSILKIFYPKPNTCYGLNKDAKILCKNSEAIKTFDLNEMEKIKKTLNQKSKAYEIVNKAIEDAIEKMRTGKITQGQIVAAQEFRYEILSIRQYYENHAIRTDFGKISVPYRYIIPLNISFNRSLQNLSSYYTDIGFIWLFTMVFIILGLVYGLIKRNANLINISSIALIGWAIRRIIGGGILRYGLGIVIWTIIGSIMYIQNITEDAESTERDTYVLYLFLFLFTIRGILQLFFNFIRISSQGSRGPFTRYKMSAGKVTIIDNNLQIFGENESIKLNYGWKDVFDLQFPHYNKFIELVKDREDKDGVLVAGTYIQYWLHNQKNIVSDGLLGSLREEMSDNDSCKTRKRLQNKNIKYLVIDPNIGTVGMGEGNETLLHRFFAKLNPVTDKIEEHGVISMLIKMNQEGFLKLINTNNLGTKYAFILDDEKMKVYFGDISPEEMILQRGKLAIAKYFEDANSYINMIANIFLERLVNGKAIGDLADVSGKIIDEEKLLKAVEALSKMPKITSEIVSQISSDLTQDERLILVQYINMLGVYKSGNQEELRTSLNNLLGQSIGANSQLIVLELL